VLASRFFGLSFSGVCGVFNALLSAASNRTLLSDSLYFSSALGAVMPKNPAQTFFDLHKLYTRTHSGEAMFCAAVLDQELRKAILSKMRKLSTKKEERIFDQALGPLHQFAAKIDIAYALNLIDEEFYDELRLIKNIRDTFAHKPKELTFFSSEIRALIKKLNFDGKATYPQIFLLRVEACLAHIIASVEAGQKT
jgi:DNA-binding MltR family transcriptional regulator